MMQRLIAYSPPYGVNYLADLETVNFMHRCGIDTMKLILSNSFSRIGIPYSPYPPVWSGTDEYHFEVVDKQIADLTEQNPDVRFIVTIDLNSPPFLVELCGKDSFKTLGECWLDPVWRRATENYQQKLIAYLEEHHFDRIAAWYIACGKTQEWFDNAVNTVTPLRVKHYAEWCRRFNRDVLPIPEGSEFEETADFVLPPHLLQWREYGNFLASECASHFFRRTRELSHGQPIGGVFANIHDLGHNGHLLAENFCREVHPDFYIGPSCNSEGKMGGASGFQSAQLMLKRYGIGYLHSCDRQLSTTALEVAPGISSLKSTHLRQPDAAADVACLKREFANALVHGFSLWFFNIWGFAYRGREVRETLSAMGKLWPEYAPLSSGSDAETLLVYDPQSDLRRSAAQTVMGSGLRRELLPEAGIPFTTAALNDLDKVDLAPYKLVIFQYCDHLSDEDAAMIRHRVCRDGRVVVWSHAPGISGDNGIDPERVEKVCGIPFAAAGREEKRFSDWHSILLRDVADWSPAELRKAGELAGIHFFTADADLKIWSSREFVSAHTGNGGRKTIRLKGRVHRVREVFSQRIVAEDTDCFTDDFAAPDTRLYHLEA